MPWPVLEHLAEQLGIEDASIVKRYTERRKTAYEHPWEIRDAYEYHEYDNPEFPHFPARAGVDRAFGGAEGPVRLCGGLAA